MRIYRASSLGYSLEQLVAGHLGYQPIDPPEWLQEKFDEGTALEPKVIAQMRNQGWNLISSQDDINAVGDNQIEVELHVIPEVAKVVGHLDAWGTRGHEDPHMVVEVKSMADKYFHEVMDKGWDTPGILQRYKWQVSAYMLAQCAPAVLVCCSKERKTDGSLELNYLRVDEPFYSISDIANKLQQAEDHIEKGLIPEGCTDYPCPYFYLHASDELPAEQADDELQPLLDAWLEADKKIKVFKKEQDSLRASIVEYIGSEGAGKVVGANGVTVSVSWQDGGEVIQKRSPKWVTRISGPRGRNVTE